MPDGPLRAPDLKIVFVHDWLTGMRGGEHVLESLCRIAPEADLLTLVHVRGSVSGPIAARRIRPSFVQWLPAAARLYRYCLPLFPVAVEQFDLDDADLVVSTSHCAAKAIVRTGRAVHVCYCHSPMRYAWDQFESYFGPSRASAPARALLRPALAWLARWDRDTAPRVDRFVANSRHVAGRIARYYNREASVLHPPVDTEFFTPGGGPSGDYFLVASALVPYKRIDRAIDAANLLGVPLRIAGDGPESARLRAIAGPNVEFLGPVDRPTLREAYRGAAAVLLPGEEDFGIVPVEAMACGRPVIGLARGGVLETVIPEVTGVLVEDESPQAFAEAMRRLRQMRFDTDVIRRHAEPFGSARFDVALATLLEDTLAARTPC